MPPRQRRSPIALRSRSFRKSPLSPAAAIDLSASLSFKPRLGLRSDGEDRAVIPSHYSVVPGPATVDNKALLLTLPIPPSVNHQYATVNGRRLLSAGGRSYKALVGQHVMIALSRVSCRQSLLAAFRRGELVLSIRFFFTSRLRRDVDGGLKIAQDALCQGLGLNDNRIVETHLYKDVDKASPRMEIRLSLASEA